MNINNEEESRPLPQEKENLSQKEIVSQEMSKIIGRYGIETVLESFIELTSPNNMTGRPEIADLHSRLAIAMNTYRKSYESRQKI